MPRPTPHDVVNKAVRQGVAVQRFTISREDAERIYAAEKIGDNDAVRLVLKILFKKPQS